MPADSDVITISIPDGEVAPYDTSYGTVSLFKKPATPDPFVNAVLTSLGEDTDGNERFWISCVNNLCGATSFLIDESGRSRVFRWPSDGGYRVIYAIAPEDRQTVWLAGGATEHLIRLDLATGSWETFPRTHGRFVTSGMIFDQQTGRLLIGAQTALISFDTREGQVSRVYEGSDKPTENFLHGGWRNGDGSYSLVAESPGLSVVRWDPAAEEIEWQQLTDDVTHPGMSLCRQSGVTESGRCYLPYFGWTEGVEANLPGPTPDREASWFGRTGNIAYGLLPDPVNLSGELLAWDVETGQTRSLFTTPDTTTMNVALPKSGKILVVDIYGQFRRYDAESGEIELTGSLDARHEHVSRTLVPIDKDRIIGTPFICQNFWVHDKSRNRSCYGGRAAGSAGQVGYAINVNGLVYFGVYGRGQLTVYDLDRLARYPDNPRPLGQTAQGNHGFGLTTDGHTVWASFKPRYGTLDGVVVRYDSETEETTYHVGTLPGQHLLGLTYDPASQALVSGTSFISDCESATPVHDRTFAVLVDPETLEILAQVAGPEDRDSLMNVGPLGDGTWLFRCESELYVFRPDDARLEAFGSLPPSTGGIEPSQEGVFVVQEGDAFFLWHPLKDEKLLIARQDSETVNAWWTHPGSLCFDCGKHTAWIQDSRLA